MTRTLTELSSKTEISISKGAETLTKTAQEQLGEREDNFDYHNCNITKNQELHYKSI